MGSSSFDMVKKIIKVLADIDTDGYTENSKNIIRNMNVRVDNNSENKKYDYDAYTQNVDNPSIDVSPETFIEGSKYLESDNLLNRYDEEEKFKVQLDNDTLQNAIIYSEILREPKCKSRIRRRKGTLA